jgi:hypothetical protein
LVEDFDGVLRVPQEDNALLYLRELLGEALLEELEESLALLTARYAVPHKSDHILIIINI